MDKIITAHLPDLETWQSSCLLFDELPYYIKDHKFFIFDKLIYEKSTSKEELHLNKGKLKIVSHNKRYLKINFRPPDENLTKYITYNVNFYEIYTMAEKLMHGKYKKYNKRWKLIYEYNYEYGKIYGKYIQYNLDGKISLELHYENDLMHGKYTSYYENGNVKEEYNYEYDKIHGKYIEYYENGNVKNVFYYTNGNKMEIVL